MNTTGFVFLLIAITVCFVILHYSEAELERERQIQIYRIRQIKPEMLHESIRSAPEVRVTILRRSGYEYDDYYSQFSNVSAALNYAANRFARARLDGFKVVKNTSKEFEIAAAYESPGGRRTGKYMGGCVIEPVRE
ncbi:hypothetical protein [Erythrobacter sp. Alg231-14]|uniref:hypothetical protein n=1 Tax=Erythrobacter sp. Alg231-14 TaxID=1922225 RepID=UPI000D554723